MSISRGSHSAAKRRISLLRVVGIGLTFVGIVIIGFIPYALYGTKASADHAQQVLKSALVPANPSRQWRPHTATSMSLKAVALENRPIIGWPVTVPLGTALAMLSVPAAGIKNDVIVEGADELRLQEGPGHYPATPLPGDPGNVAIAGHRTTWLRPFYNLQAAKPGDMVQLQVGPFVYEYKTTSVAAVSPNDVSVLRPLKGWWLTLTTCTPRFSASQRLVLRAHLVEVKKLIPTSEIHALALDPQAASVVEIRPKSPIMVFSSTPWPVLVLWLFGVFIGIVTGFVRLKHSRYSLLFLIPAAACCFEAYGAAVRFLPTSW